MRYLYIILWLLLGLFYWYISNQCCQSSSIDGNGISATESSSITGSEITGDKDKPPYVRLNKNIDYPFAFKWSEAQPLTGSKWDSFRDSILGTLDSKTVLEVTGLYSPREKEGNATSELGIARSNSIVEALKLAEERYEIKSREISDVTIDSSGKFKAYDINSLIVTENVVEETVEDEFGNMSLKTTVYFPFNSTRKLNNREVESYLDEVAKRIRSTGERVQIVGHTDNVGDNKSNLTMGQARADIVKDYLVGKGLNPSQIITTSKGKSNPIASNDSEEGRAKNRRAELTIIK